MNRLYFSKGGDALKRLGTVLLILVLVLSLATTVSAATGITGGNISATVSSDGSCLVTAEFTVHIESGDQDLVFPLPTNAKSITINGRSARTTLSGTTRGVKLSSALGNVTGDFSIRLQYTLTGTVAYDESDRLILTLPLLSGFYHPIRDVTFNITLPEGVILRPSFSSGYYGQAIESSLQYQLLGNSITGAVIKELQDRETLTMTMEVSDTVFPQNPVQQWTIGIVEILMIVFAALAVIYWSVFLRSLPFSQRPTITSSVAPFSRV
jgi:hypothetical protein